MHFKIAVIGRRGVYYRDKRGISQSTWVWSWSSPEDHPVYKPSLLLASAFPSPLFCLHSCLPAWFNVASPGPTFMWSPLKPSSIPRPASLSPAQQGHVNSGGSVTEVGSTWPRWASTAEGPASWVGADFREEGCRDVSKGVYCNQKWLLCIPEHS